MVPAEETVKHTVKKRKGAMHLYRIHIAVVEKAEQNLH